MGGEEVRKGERRGGDVRGWKGKERRWLGAGGGGERG